MTWGELKKSMEEEKVQDDYRILIDGDKGNYYIESSYIEIAEASGEDHSIDVDWNSEDINAVIIHGNR